MENLPMYVFYCSNMFICSYNAQKHVLINKFLYISEILTFKGRKTSFPESSPQNRDIIRWNVPPVVIRSLRFSRC